MACAALGRTDFAAKTIRMNKQRFRHYDPGQRAFHRDVAAMSDIWKDRFFIYGTAKNTSALYSTHIDFAGLPLTHSSIWCQRDSASHGRMTETT